MKITLEEEDIEAIATAIAAKIGSGSAAAAEEEDDLLGGGSTKKEPTIEDVQNAVTAGVGAHGKDKVRDVLKKVAKAGKVADVPADKYQAVLDALAKLK